MYIHEMRRMLALPNGAAETAPEPCGDRSSGACPTGAERAGVVCETATRGWTAMDAVQLTEWKHDPEVRDVRNRMRL